MSPPRRPTLALPFVEPFLPPRHNAEWCRTAGGALILSHPCYPGLDW